MAVIVVQQERTKQPSGPAPLKTPLGILFGAVPVGLATRSLAGVGLLGYSQATQTGTLLTGVSQFGRAVVKDADVGDYVEATLSSSDQISLIAFWKPSSAGTARRVIDGDDISLNRQYQFRLNSSNQPEFIRFDTGGSPYFATCSAAANSTDCCVMIATSNGANIRMYYARHPFSDYLTASGTIGGSPKPFTVHRLYASLGGSDYADGDHYFEAVANRAWSEAEVQKLLRNPWSIFEPEELPYFFTSGPPPAGLAANPARGGGAAINPIWGMAA